MSSEDSVKSVITNLIMKLCSLERYIEIKRQMLCDKNDFEPYVAFQRLVRRGQNGISSGSILQYLSENMIDLRLDQVRAVVGHYDSDSDGILSYKEFLEVVLPKEHPELRAFVTQRECFDINTEEYLSYETEAAMAVLFNLEVALFEDSKAIKDELAKLGVDGFDVVGLIDGNPQGSLNFNNIQRYLNQSGLLPYDSEIISFLRRIDRDDDGVITGEELQRFFERYKLMSNEILPGTQRDQNLISKAKLECLSPGRKIVRSKANMIPVHDGVQIPIIHAHKFIPGTDNLIEKSIVSARVQGEGLRSSANIGVQRITPRGMPQLVAEQMQLNQAQNPHVAMHRAVLSESQIAPNLRQAIVNNPEIYTKHSDHVKIPEYVQSNANLLGNHYHASRAQQEDRLEKVLGGLKSSENVIKTYETFGRKLVTPNPKHGLAFDQDIQVNAMHQNVSEISTPISKNVVSTSNCATPVVGFQKRNQLEFHPEIEQNKENIHVNRQTERTRSRDFQRQLIFQDENYNHETSHPLNQKKLAAPLAQRQPLQPTHALNQQQIHEEAAKDYQETAPSSRSQLALQRGLDRKDQASKSRTFSTRENSLQQNDRAGQPMVAEARKLYNTNQTASNQMVMDTHATLKSEHSEFNTVRTNQISQEITPENQQFLRRLTTTQGDSKSQPNPEDRTARQFFTGNTTVHSNAPSANLSKMSPYPAKESRNESRRRLRSPGERSKSPRSRSGSRRLENGLKDYRKGSRRMLKPSQANLGVKVFADTLIDLVEFERDVEQSKRTICGQNDFCGEVLVSLVDQRGLGYVEFSSFRNFVEDLVKYNVKQSRFNQISEQEIQSLYEEIRDYSKLETQDPDQNCAGYDALVGLVCPRDSRLEQALAREMQEKEFRDFQRNGISVETQMALTDCFEMLFQQRRMITIAKVEFKKRNIEFHDVFESIDSMKKGFLTSEDFRAFVTANNTEFAESNLQEVDIFVDSCDLDRDGKVTFKDFYLFFSAQRPKAGPCGKLITSRQSEPDGPRSMAMNRGTAQLERLPS